MSKADAYAQEIGYHDQPPRRNLGMLCEVMKKKINRPELGRVYARLGEVDKSQHMFAEFERLHRKEQQDPGSLDQEQNDDARQATQAP